MRWEAEKVLVTGGASFIGSHLVDALAKRGAHIRVIDDLSSGKMENLRGHLVKKSVDFIKADLRRQDTVKKAVRGMDIVFHLAAAHGGRGFVDLHQAACAENLMLDGLIFQACLKEGVEKVIYASSGCVYPNYLQADVKKILYLKEDMAGPPYDADNMYGWAKLMAEMTLRAYYKDFGLKSASCRYFTVYGERGVENHAVIAMIARAFIKQDPFEVWGDGCLPADELVVSNLGFQAISEINKGDKVLGLDGQYHTVVGTMRREYNGAMISVKPIGMRLMRFTSEHPILITRLKTVCNVLGKNQPHKCKPNCWCLDKKYRYHHRPHKVKLLKAWIPAGEVKPDDFVMIPRVKVEGQQIVELRQYVRLKCSNSYRREDMPFDQNFAYFLGWYTAEGWTSWKTNKHNRAQKALISLALGLKEKNVLKKLMDCIASLGFKPNYRKRQHNYEVYFSSTHLAMWLDRNIGKGAHNKRVPSLLFQANKDIIMIYLDSLFQGDGYRAQYDQRLTSTSRQLLNGVQLLLAKIGYFGYLSWFTKSYKGKIIDQGVIGYTCRKQRQYWVDDDYVYVPVSEVKQDPFKGYVYNIETTDATFCCSIMAHNSQVRNWTYVDDIVEGTILAAEKISDGTAINLGTMERVRVLDAVKEILRHTGHKAKIELQPNMPTGPYNRVADNSLAKKLLEWSPAVKFIEGLHRTIDWYFSNKDRRKVKKILDKMLTER